MSNNTTAIPEHFICPITQEIIKDPVVDREGVSYERQAILKWLESNTTSPMTRKPLKKDDLVPNRALKEAIEQLLAGAGGSDSASAKTNATTVIGPQQPNEEQSKNNKQNHSHQEQHIGVNIYQHPNDQSELIAVFTPPKQPRNGSLKNRLPADIVCAVDVSGSTGSSAPTQDQNGKKEETGLTILQIVGHAVRTVAAMLEDGDRLSLVTFSNDARVTLPLTNMNDAGKASVDRIVKSLEPYSRTNLWAGLQKSVDLLASSSSSINNNNKARIQTILLLTDGVPTEHPPRGYEQTFKALLKRTFPASSNKTRPITVHTFGFGYDLDSKLLDSLAEIGGGSFCHLSDGGMVGTNFVNTVATLLTTAATDVTISIPAAARQQVTDDSSDEDDSQQQKEDLKVNFGDVIRFGNTSEPYWIQGASERAKVVNVSFNSPTEGRVSLEVPVQSPESLDLQKFERMNLRRAFVDTVRSAAHASVNSTDLHKHIELVRATIQTCKNTKAGKKNSQLSQAIVTDLEDQVLLALKNQEYFTRWGRHYFLSLARANELAICTNFKDRSVAQWKSKMFEDLQEAGETSFLSLAPPEPSLEQKYLAAITNNPDGVPADIQQQIMKQQQDRGLSNSSRTRATNQQISPARIAAGFVGSNTSTTTASSTTINRPARSSMATYYNRGGGCVFPDCQVLLADGTTSKAAQDIRHGDVLFGGGVVDCAVKIDKKNETMSMVFFEGGLVVSEFHPVQLKGDNKSYFPIDLVKQGVAKQKNVAVDCLYTFVLKQSCSDHNNNNNALSPFINMNGVNVISWGHEQRGDEVVTHDFFSSREKVVASLKKISDEGYERKGQVTVTGFVRDQETNRIVDLF